jgi:hypothetical protein
MRARHIFALAALVIVSGASHAAKPVKITPGSKETNAAGEEFRNYIVECSNGKKYPIISWPNRKQWCVDNNIPEDDCWKKQIKAAKEACKGSNPTNLPAAK